MGVTLKSFLQNSLTPIDRYSRAQPTYHWAYIKSKNTIKYLETESDEAKESLEKILAVMNRQLKVFTKVPFIEADEKRQLNALKIMVKSYGDSYKLANSGFFGRIYLVLKGIFHGGHIETLQEKINNKIDLLISKRTGKTPFKSKIKKEDRAKLDGIKNQMDSFLKLVAPSDFNQDMNRWALCKSKNILKYDPIVNDPILGTDQFVKCKLEKVLVKMHQQLKIFKKLEFIDEGQKNKLTNLKGLIQEQVKNYKKKHSKIYLITSGIFNGGNIIPLKNQVMEDIDFLLHQINTPPPPSFETKEHMRFQATCIRMEILKSEEVFIEKLNLAIEGIHYLISLNIKGVQCSSKFQHFFKETTGICLPKCLAVFSKLKGYGEDLQQKFEEVQNDNYDDEEKNQALTEIYTSELFRSYTKAMTLSVRYNRPLQKLFKDLKSMNRWSDKHPNVRRFKDDGNHYSVVIQRLPRHQLFMTEFLKNIPSDSIVYPFAFSAWESTERNARYLNNKIGKKLA